MDSIVASAGNTCLLWDDCWSGQPLRISFPELHSFAKQPSISLSKAVAVQARHDLFNLPLSVEAFNQFQQFVQCLEDHDRSQRNDRWVYIWGNSEFSASRA